MFINVFVSLSFGLLVAFQSEGSSYQSNLQEDHKVFQGMSLLGDSLFTSVDSAAMEKQLNDLSDAQRQYQEEESLYNLIWVGRREAYLGRHDLAIKTFTQAIEKYPDSYEALRHRGHRYISIREFEKAVSDFSKAAQLMEGKEIQIEEDGIPNKLNQPLSTVQFNVWYHLGLAHYLLNDYENALKAYEKCLEVSDNDDLVVATLDWYYMTLIKMDREAEARELLDKVHADMEIIENDAYHKRLMTYKGEVDEDDLINGDLNSDQGKLQYVTQGYGLGNHYLRQGKIQEATETFMRVMKTNYWSAFGYIASEMELAKLKNE
ncbi:tetratricopeptide repeat protein [Litoribacter ruber]|uniref:tetratricopeptide repeat protein n=1 Tax=Litoribacter ruber TaxID=702568 RepID=UPI001BDB367A|nr:tetratricopeptide repeat protein [Litoribacter ruber]MBT0811013.1 tetratricopeptide repeat protein [Litoribacter ruber]